MLIVQSYELNKEKWDKLVEKYRGSCYSRSWYLDATAKNWCVLTDEAYSKGIALSYNSVFGQKILYPPIFGRTLEFFACDASELETLFSMIQAEFSVGQIQFAHETGKLKAEIRTYQQTDGSGKMNTLSKRMLSKAKQAGLEIREVGFELLIPVIKKELGAKVRELNPANLDRLRSLLKEAGQRKQLFSSGIFLNGELCGGMYFLKDGDRILYLLGAGSEEIKKNGGMYLCMHEGIQRSVRDKLLFDFGGSNIENIRRFFVGMGGSDVRYYSYSWDHSPVWFRLMRKIKRYFN